MVDPLVEAAFNELDPDDKADFPEIVEAIKTKQIKERSNPHKLTVRGAKRKRAKATASGASSSLGPAVEPDLVDYEDIDCGRVAGQFKLHQGPGNRDKPSWFLRVKDPSTGSWAENQPLKRTIIQTPVDGPAKNRDWAINWVRENRQCCSSSPSG